LEVIPSKGSAHATGARVIPDNFRFSAKIPQEVTHKKRFGQGIADDMHYFYKAFEPLKSKVLCVL
jgi:uncharacterized protein YecE (DUF72 family)